jgi:hypothetical protein
MMNQAGIAVEWLGGNCPVQAEGTFDGTPFYFRARGTEVRCDVGDWHWDGPEYEWPDAGWISQDLAHAFIHEAYEAWQRRGRSDSAYEIHRRRRNDQGARAMSAIVWSNWLKEHDHNVAAEALMKYAGELLLDKGR